MISTRVKKSSNSLSGARSMLLHETNCLSLNRKIYITSSNKLLRKFASPVNRVQHELAGIFQDILKEGNTIRKAKSAWKALKICSDEEGTYQKEMKAIVKAVHEAVFMEKNIANAQVLNAVYEKHTDALLDSEFVPYFYIAESALDLLVKSQFEAKQLQEVCMQRENSDF